MNPAQRKYALYIEDMLTSIKRIEEYTNNKSFSEFKKNYMIVDAVIRNFEIIGEATKNIPADIQERHKEIPWKKMYNLRNLISHVYFGIDYEMIWEIVKNNLPQNKIDLKLVLKEIKL
ncbi:MAG: DUF86 domain-containing protein [Bacteroidales bacterium]|jgi:uncharacterized protein with HEPN domain